MRVYINVEMRGLEDTLVSVFDQGSPCGETMEPAAKSGNDEVFLVGTVCGILPATMVGGVRGGNVLPGTITRRLLKLHQRLTREAR